MIESYQEEQELMQEEPQDVNFAIIDEVYDDGVSLIFPGETEPTEKHYKVNAFVVFQPGDRVRIIKDSGTYVVEYPVGNPKRTFSADTASTAKTADFANFADEADRLSGAVTITLTGDLSGTISFSGPGIATANITAVRAAALRNDYSSSTGYDIYLYAQYGNQLGYRIGRNGTLHMLANN